MGFSVIGLVIAIVTLLPFILILFFRPKNKPDGVRAHNIILTIITYVGLIGNAVILCISQENFENIEIAISPWFWLSVIAFIGFALFWGYYFLNQDFSRLYQAFGVVPMPIAFFTVLLLCFLSIFIHQVYMWINTIVVGIGIVGNSLYVYFQSGKNHPKNNITKHKINQR